MNPLQQKIIIVTGASSGIGRRSARLFAASGATVIACARRANELKSLAAEASEEPGEILPVVGDITDPDVHQRLVSLALDRYGRLDGAFNNAAALGELVPLDQLSDQLWFDVIQTNLTGAMFAARAQIPAMAASGGGSIVFTGTFVGHTTGMPGMAAYAASKAGLLGLVKVLAVEQAGAKIRVNAVVPGGIDTPMGRVFANSPEAVEFVANLHALKRMGSAHEVAQAVQFLLSDAASFVTGSTMMVDGGASICKT